MAKKDAVKPKKKAGLGKAGGAKKATPAPKAKTAVKAVKTAKPKATAAVKTVPPAKSAVKTTASSKVAAPVVAPLATAKQPAAPKVSKSQPRTLTAAGHGEAQVATVPVAKNKAAVQIVPSDDPEVQKLQQKWLGLYDKSKNIPAPDYSMSGVFEAKTPIQHKVLGWGYILSNQYDRLEVLFQDGIRFLISNYKK